jgi:hypothetical protein
MGVMFLLLSAALQLKEPSKAAIEPTLNSRVAARNP